MFETSGCKKSSVVLTQTQPGNYTSEAYRIRKYSSTPSSVKQPHPLPSILVVVHLSDPGFMAHYDYLCDEYDEY